ncbi:hypothetical protein PFISCL1PPCAC_15618, partial [Pristionchus fissidentatus]
GVDADEFSVEDGSLPLDLDAEYVRVSHESVVLDLEGNRVLGLSPPSHGGDQSLKEVLDHEDGHDVVNRPLVFGDVDDTGNDEDSSIQLNEASMRHGTLFEYCKGEGNDKSGECMTTLDLRSIVRSPDEQLFMQLYSLFISTHEAKWMLLREIDMAIEEMQNTAEALVLSINGVNKKS